MKRESRNAHVANILPHTVVNSNIGEWLGCYCLSNEERGRHFTIGSGNSRKTQDLLAGACAWWKWTDRSPHVTRGWSGYKVAVDNTWTCVCISNTLAETCWRGPARCLASQGRGRVDARLHSAACRAPHMPKNTVLKNPGLSVQFRVSFLLGVAGPLLCPHWAVSLGPALALELPYRAPRSGWLYTMGNYCLPVWSPEVRHRSVHSAMELWRLWGECAPCPPFSFSGLPSSLGTPGLWTHHPSLCLTFSWPCTSLSVSLFLQGHRSQGIRAHLNVFISITPAKIRFPKKATFTGTRG